MASKGFTHIDLFNDNSGGWTLSNATISGGLLNITSDGWGTRNVDANWYFGINDNFIVEADVKMDTVGNAGWNIGIKLVGDGNEIICAYRGSTYDKIRIWYGGVIKVETGQAIDDANWHTAKVRRVGTTYYFSVDGGTEISWNYGTARAIEYIKLRHQTSTGKFDNFKYSWIKAVLEGAISFSGSVNRKLSLKRLLEGDISFIGTLSFSRLFKQLLEGTISFVGELNRKVSYKRIQEGAISFIGTLQRKLSLHRLLEGSISFIGTLLGSRLFKKTLEGAISFIGTLSRTRTYRRTLEGIISFVGKLKVTKLWRAVSKMSNIWTPEDKRSNVWTPQDKRDNDWIEE